MAAVPGSSSGPLSVELTGHNSVFVKGLAPTTFEVRVKSGASDEGLHDVRRRYTSFEQLASNLRPQFPDLPEMPPKGFWRKRFCRSFMAERQRRLNEILAFLVRADPGVEVPELRHFLGLVDERRSNRPAPWEFPASETTEQWPVVDPEKPQVEEEEETADEAWMCTSFGSMCTILEGDEETDCEDSF